MKHTYLLLLLFLLGAVPQQAQAQENFPRNGAADHRSGAYAFVHATLYLDYQTKIEDATLLIRDGRVVQAGAGLAVPAGYATIDLKGKFVYPSFIDLHTHYGMPKVEQGGMRWGNSEQIEPATPGAYNANDAIKAHFEASEAFEANPKQAAQWRAQGFGAVLAFRPDGLARGTSVLATLADDRENAVILKGKAAAHYAFSKGSSAQDYPWSLMGFVAVLRQTHFDAVWYEKAKGQKLFDHSLEAYLAQATLPQVFEVSDWQGLLRAHEMGRELGKRYIFRTGGDEYQRLDAVKATGSALILPLDFPEAYKIDDPLDALDISLADMKHWELAPANPARVAKAGIPFAFTLDGLKDPKMFWAQLRKAVKHGLPEAEALKALTASPATLIGAPQLGDLRPGKLANFIIASGNLFDDGAVQENWIQGHRYVLDDISVAGYEGKYGLSVGDSSFVLEISGKGPKAAMKVFVNDSTSVKGEGGISDEGMMTLAFQPEGRGIYRLSGWFNDAADTASFAFSGRAAMPDGRMVDWKASYQGRLEAGKPKGKKEEEAPALGEVTYPFAAYGAAALPTASDFIIKNATVWTNEAEGILEQADVIVRGGKIAQVGKGLSDKGLVVIDGTGKHVTPGIIDEHSHIALRGVNDVATISAQVRMSDVVNSEDPNIYRQLAGGVTAAQLLHGSANPVGGQSAIIKLRWGRLPQEMLVDGAAGFIKFALGENVKRSSSQRSIRFPQTRMGVEQVYVDAFTEAKAYDAAWKAWKALPAREQAQAPAPRRDLQLETLAQILNGERFITCHSYVQSEINMLMHVADRFGFRVNTFTHILEGYKVADKMKRHGVGASTFSDWWAYKFEVKDAIPYNPILMHEEGVVVAINSDDAEMGRRLNQEAAKSIKYGGMAEEDALKMVTLNPARLLRLDHRMGSLKPGKDADLVLWSAHPLSIYARAEKTFVDGVAYYDAERDAQLQLELERERARLVGRMKAEGGSRPATPRMEPHFHCEDLHQVGVR